jgi:serine/threonine protein kinase
MPLPNTAPELLELVRKSGVLEGKRLDAYLDQLTASATMPAEAAKLAGLMVRDGMVTHFQAEQFMLGKWRRFTIGKYKVLEKLGSGGMGSVYLCEHKLMRRRVAVKILPTAKAEDPAALERFYREARAVAALDHPNIVRAYDIDQDEKLHYLVMEHVDGSNLQEIIKKTGPLDPSRAAHYIRQAALGLQHAHEAAGLVHRDIKPGNILVDRNGIVKVLDMGLARFFHEEEDSITRKYDESVLGTADYLAPEQAINSHEVDIRADIYSLGATLYFVLTGKTPFNEGSIAQKLIWHQTRQPKSVKLLRAEVPDGIAAVIEKSMAKDPNQRFSTPQAMAEALSPWTQEPIPPPSAAEMPQLSRAAMGIGPGDSGGPGSGPASSSGSTSPAPRKTWLVAGASPSAIVPTLPAVPPAPAPSVTAPAVDTPASAPPTRETRTDTSSRASGPSPTPGNVTGVPAKSLSAARPAIRKAAPRPPSGPAVPQLRPSPTVAEESVAGEQDSPSWEKLAGDTDDLTSRADTAPGTKRNPLAAARRIAAPAVLRFREQKWFWWAVGGAAAGVVVLALLLWWALTPARARTASGPASREPLSVFATDRGGAGASLRAHLQSAKNGDVIEICDDVAANDINTGISNAKNLTIQGREGKTIVWRAPAEGAMLTKLLTLNAAAGMTLRNLTFDGEGRLDSLVTLFGESPGLTLKNVRFQGFRRCGVWVMNCAGTFERPVNLESLRFTTTKPDQIAVYFDINSKIQGIAKDQYISVHDCAFDGPGTKYKASGPGLVDHVDLPDGALARGQ